MGSDPASVAFDTVQSAKNKGAGCSHYRYGGSFTQQSQSYE